MFDIALSKLTKKGSQNMFLSLLIVKIVDKIKSLDKTLCTK